MFFPLFLTGLNNAVLEHVLLSVAHISSRHLYVLPKTGVSFSWESGICIFSPGIARLSVGVSYVLPGFVSCAFLPAKRDFDRRSVLKVSRSKMDFKTV